MPHPLIDTSPRTRAARFTLREIRAALRRIEDADQACALRRAHPGQVVIEDPLAEWLYVHWWTTGDPPRPVDTAPQSFPRVGVLEAARRRTVGVASGWIVLATGETTLTVVSARPALRTPRGPLHIRVDADRVVDSSRPGLSPAPGDRVTLTHGASGWDRDNGWWWAHGADDGSVPDGPLDRWYVNAAGPEHAALLLHPLLSSFDEAGSGYSLKCLPSFAGYGRADSLVAYTPRALTTRVTAALRRNRRDIAPHVLAFVPPTTRRIVPGIGMSQDPADGESFGMLRTAQVAAIAATTANETEASAEAPDDLIAAAATAAGIDLDHPWRAA